MTTMTKTMCDVCNKNPSIGVAATVTPYSCAYCIRCAERFAQPLLVFECFYDDAKDGTRLADWVWELETCIDGQYLTYREYAAQRDGERLNK